LIGTTTLYMGMGIIARDSLGNVWGSMCSYMKYLTDPATVEAYAARWGVEFCRDMGFQSVILEGDAQVKVKAIQTGGEGRSRELQ
jgi:ribonuclease HI